MKTYKTQEKYKQSSRAARTYTHVVAVCVCIWAWLCVCFWNHCTWQPKNPIEMQMSISYTSSTECKAQEILSIQKVLRGNKLGKFAYGFFHLET